MIRNAKGLVFTVFSLVLLFAWTALRQVSTGNAPAVAYAQGGCQVLTAPDALPAPAVIRFDDLPNGAVIGARYQPSFGVVFEDNKTTRALIYGNEPSKAASAPNVATNDAVPPNTSSGVPMSIRFDEPKSHVGFYIGNGGAGQIAATLVAYNASGQAVCRAAYGPVPDAHTYFMGVYDPSASIVQVTLDYGATTLSEAIDDLYFSPRPGGAVPTRTPVPTWTPVPSPTPTQGPTPTPAPVLPLVAYFPPPVAQVYPALFSYDLSIHGIEITEGIQCFNPAQGLAGCGDNSLPLVTQKSAAARIYLKYSGNNALLGSVPVKLYLRANGVWYSATAYGKPAASINQESSDSADIFFRVNFPQGTSVDFYAVVDPDNVYGETDESNNRYPASGYLTLNFQQRTALNISGQRLRYHPSGYTGTQYAGGWAVNGGAANWLEQVLPLANNAVDYSVASGYLDWTKSLGASSNQHALIRTLNVNWVLQNAFSWLFSGPFVGADHVYGWAPNSGYSGGHADMPVYPHAGGLGVAAIGTDRAGTSTDNPGGGALIFGHELVHDYNVYHTNTSDSCGSSDSSSNFPYSSSSIQEVGFNPVTGRIYTPSTTHDLMSYCPAAGSRLGWVSPFTWSTMFTNLSPGLQTYYRSERGLRTGYLMPTAAQESLVVNATVFNPLYSPPAAGMLGDLYRVSVGVAYYPPKGAYAIELRDADNIVLLSQSFAVNFESEYDAHADAPPFPPDPTTQADVSFIIPWVDGAAFVALTHQGQDIAVRAVSGNPPQVFFTSPLEAETWQPGSVHTLAWDGLDLDGDPLTYTLFYSNDGGNAWTLLQSGITDASFDVSADSLAGGSDARFRVVATDGVNTDSDETPQAIAIPNQPPEATISAPEAGGIHLPGALIVFQGLGSDMEDGILPDDALVWSDDLQGELGRGPVLPVASLKPGAHTITLTVTDAYGISSRATVSVTVGYPLYLPILTR